MTTSRRSLLVLLVLLSAAISLVSAGAEDLPSIFTQDVTRFTQLLSRRLPELRVEGIQGLSHLKYWPAEEEIIELLPDPSPPVHREVVLALGRLGTARSVPHLIRMLDDPSWEIRHNAWLGLCRLTAQRFSATEKSAWQQWWNAGAATNHEAILLAAVTNANPALPRHDALHALKTFASPSSEPTLARLLWLPSLTVEERNCLAEALERVGSAKAIPALAGLHTDAAAWALGRIGGAAAEQALLKFPKSLAVLINLERLPAIDWHRGVGSLSRSPTGEDVLGYSRQARRLSYHTESRHRCSSY